MEHHIADLKDDMQCKDDAIDEVLTQMQLKKLAALVQRRNGKDDNSTGGSAVEEECIIVGGKVKKQGHAG